MGLIDSHAHLTFDALAHQVDEVLARAEAAGVDHVISIATDMADAARVLDLARAHSCVSAAMGFHPHEAGKITDADWGLFGNLVVEPDIVAIGEMGLDYHYDFADRRVQQEVFARQLEVATPTGKPIIIHCREAHDDAVAILREGGYAGRPVVFHCFTGTQAEAAALDDNGWRLSFTGVVTFKNAGDLVEIARSYPLDRMMVETDAPYLSPIPVRNVRPNEPAHVAHTARFLANLKAIPFEDFAAQTSANTRAFFGLR